LRQPLVGLILLAWRAALGMLAGLTWWSTLWVLTGLARRAAVRMFWILCHQKLASSYLRRVRF
jgi:hypothetical protein